MRHQRLGGARRRASSPGARRGHERGPGAPRPRLRWRGRAGLRGARHAAARDRRPRGWRPADGDGRRQGRAGLQRRAVRRAPRARAAGGARRALPDALGHRGPAARARGRRRGLSGAPRRHVRFRVRRHARAHAAPRARPDRDQAAVLVALAARRAGVLVGDREPPGAPRGAAAARPRVAGDAARRPPCRRPVDVARGRAPAPARAPVALEGRRRRGARVQRAALRARADARGGGAGGAARAPRRERALPARRGRARGRVPLRRHRLEHRRGLRRASAGRARRAPEDLLGRILAPRPRRERDGARRRPRARHRPPRAAGRGVGLRPGVARPHRRSRGPAPRRHLVHPHLARFARRARGGRGRALGRRRRRAVRRLRPHPLGRRRAPPGRPRPFTRAARRRARARGRGSAGPAPARGPRAARAQGPRAELPRARGAAPPHEGAVEPGRSARVCSRAAAGSGSCARGWPATRRRCDRSNPSSSR